MSLDRQMTFLDEGDALEDDYPRSGSNELRVVGLFAGIGGLELGRRITQRPRKTFPNTIPPLLPPCLRASVSP